MNRPGGPGASGPVLPHEQRAKPQLTVALSLAEVHGGQADPGNRLILLGTPASDADGAEHRAVARPGDDDAALNCKEIRVVVLRQAPPARLHPLRDLHGIFAEACRSV